jgi:hypothetical protein
MHKAKREDLEQRDTMVQALQKTANGIGNAFSFLTGLNTNHTAAI